MKQYREEWQRPLSYLALPWIVLRLAIFAGSLTIVEDDVSGTRLETALVNEPASLVPRPVSSQRTTAAGPRPFHLFAFVVGEVFYNHKNKLSSYPNLRC